MKLACLYPHPKATLPQATRRCYAFPVDPLRRGGGGIPAHGWHWGWRVLDCQELCNDLLRTQCVFLRFQNTALCCRRCSRARPSSCCVALRGSGRRGMNCLMHSFPCFWAMFLGKDPGSKLTLLSGGGTAEWRWRWSWLSDNKLEATRTAVLSSHPTPCPADGPA